MQDLIPAVPVYSKSRPELHLDTVREVTLLTPDRARLGRFYGDVLGLIEHRCEPGFSRWQAAPTTPEPPSHGLTLKLVEDRQARPRPRSTVGLFHTAFLLPDRPALAAATRRLLHWADRDPAVRYHGYAEHGVSEAIYGTDPDGNGVEFTLDHPFDDWPHLESGERGGDRLAIITAPLSLPDLLREAPAAPLTRSFSHVHLNVGDLASAEKLLVGQWRMHVVQRSYPGALFLAYGDYHHHLAVNTWMGEGEPALPSGTTGLLDLTLHTPTGMKRRLAIQDLARS